MTIFVLGINHETAPISLREAVHFSLDKLPLLLQDITSNGHAREAFFISTCNRMELYCEAEELQPVYDWLLAEWPNEKAAIEKALYVHRDEEAIQHMMSVACGLDSMVIGEPQILGQMKEAFSESCTAGSVGAVFYRLFQQIFNVAKEVRTSTTIGACPVSVASAAVHFAKNQEIGTTFNEARAVLIGAGDTGQLLMRYLAGQIKKPISILNRSVEKAESLATAFGANAYGMDALQHLLIESDIVFSATSSPTPIINKALMAEVMIARLSKPLCLIDIAVPRDIDPSISELPNVTLYCVDDLKSIIEKNRRGRHHAADKAEQMIREKSRELFAELQSLDKVAHTIRTYRGQIESLCRTELFKAKQQLHNGLDACEVLEMFARNFTQKLMHAPSVQLRQAGVEGRFELLRFAKQLFSLPDPETELL